MDYGMARCDYCNETFTKKRPNARFCCDEHRAKSGQRRRAGYSGSKYERRKCAYCQNEISSDRIKKYCSEECMKKAGSLAGNRKRRAQRFNCNHIKYSVNDIVSRDGLDCSHCGITTSLHVDSCSSDKANLDHIIPISRGGHDAEYNIQILCRACNTKKGSKILPKDVDKAKRLMPSDKELLILKSDKQLLKNNKSGVVGVFFSSYHQKWIARLEKNKDRIIVAMEKDKEKAIHLRKYALKLLSKGMALKEIKEEVKKANANAKNS